MVMDKRLWYYLKDSVLFTSSSLLFPGSSSLLQKSKCSEHHPSTSSPVVSTRSLNRKQLPVFVLCAVSISSLKSSLKTFLCSQTLSSVHLPGDACVLVCVCISIFDFLLLVWHMYAYMCKIYIVSVLSQPPCARYYYYYLNWSRTVYRL